MHVRIPAATPSRAAAVAAVFAAALLVTVCEPTPTAPTPEGGAYCLAGLDFDREPAIVEDGRSCTVGATGDKEPFGAAACDAGAEDWPFSLDVVDADFDDYSVDQRTRLTFYRITPPVPPTESDLYLVSELSGASAIDDRIRVSFGISPTADPADMRGFVIRPVGGDETLTGSAVAVPVDVDAYRWDTGSSAWVSDAAAADAVDAHLAYDEAGGYWGVETRLRLPDVGVDGDYFYLASHWRSPVATLPVDASDWHPLTAAPSAATDPNLPAPDPTTWVLYSFGEDCAPDVYINSTYNTCADIYINERDENARRVAVNNVNDFHAVVHGDDDADPALGGITAQDVRVYLDISHLGIGTPPWAMNYDHTDANINWEGATRSLQTATPEPPNTFSVAPQTTNDDVRVQWMPANEPDNPFEEGQHVCVNAYVYSRDDPNLDNNFGQCNMQFVDTVEGRAVELDMMMGGAFRWFGEQRPTELVLVPAVVNTAVPLTAQNEWRVELQGDGLEPMDGGGYRVSLPGYDQPLALAVRFVVPDGAVAEQREEHGFTSRSDRVTREFYGDRPLFILRSFVPVRYRERDGGTVTVLRPGSYAGVAVNVRR